jgi:hypothetical protein
MLHAVGVTFVSISSLEHDKQLALEGLELLQTGRIPLPIREPARSHLRAVRAGEPPLADVLAEIADVTTRLDAATAAADLPDEPDRA